MPIKCVQGCTLAMSDSNPKVLQGIWIKTEHSDGDESNLRQGTREHADPFLSNFPPTDSKFNELIGAKTTFRGAFRTDTLSKDLESQVANYLESLKTLAETPEVATYLKTLESDATKQLREGDEDLDLAPEPVRTCNCIPPLLPFATAYAWLQLRSRMWAELCDMAPN